MKYKFEHEGDCCNCGASQYMAKCKGICDNAIPISNADRIRAMSDEELAKWMLDWVECDNDGYMCAANRYKNSKRCDGHCIKNRLDWLRQPATE